MGSLLRTPVTHDFIIPVRVIEGAEEEEGAGCQQTIKHFTTLNQ